MESFDPIGRYRTRYRVSGGKAKYGDYSFHLPPKSGLPVDASGVTAEGQKFSGMEEYKRHLMSRNEQVARNFITQLITYSTGGEIQFSDRIAIEAILKATGPRDYPVKDIIHEVILSKLFRKP